MSFTKTFTSTIRRWGMVQAALLLVFPCLPATLNASGGIVVSPDRDITVKKVMPIEARLVRGFGHAPIDGRTDTRHAKGVVVEWVGYHGLPAVNYREFNGNNGMHIALPDEPFNAVVIRGGWVGRVFADLAGYLNPHDSVTPLFTTAGEKTSQVYPLQKPVHARRVSFFTNESITQPLANVTFLHVSHHSDQAVAVREDQPALKLPTLKLSVNQMSTVSLEPTDVTRGVGAVVLSFEVDETQLPMTLDVAVRDVLDARRTVMDTSFQIVQQGVYTLTLDMPDQVFLSEGMVDASLSKLGPPVAPEPMLALQMTADRDVELTNVAITPRWMAREKALVEAGAWRKLMLRGLFSNMSEPRPWMLLKDGEPIREQLDAKAMSRYRTSLLELLENLEITRQLLPDDALVKQYHDWIYQNLERRKPMPPPVVDVDPGAPQWAILARQSWREVSDMAQWWLDHRLVQGGLLGGGAQDDTDMFQTWQCLPMIEDAPLGDALRKAAGDLGQFIVENKLTDGLNRTTNDALHAYEEGINQIALNAWWFHGDPVHFERAMAAARGSISLMVDTKDGRTHFASGDIGIDVVREGLKPEGKSTPYGYAWLFLHPMYEVASYNANPLVLDKYRAWARTWANLQKPGAYVSRVEIETGQPLEVTTSQRGPVSEWLALYQLTGEKEWLDALLMGMQPGEYWGFHAPYGVLPHALIDWPEKWQPVVAEKFKSDRSGYAAFFLNKDRRWLDQWLLDSASWFGRFRYMHTEAEQKTDRVFTYNASVPLACYLGDAPNRNRWVRFNAVSYEGMRGEDFAAIVSDAGNNRLRVAIYNFRNTPADGVIRTWRLDHGRYEVRMGTDQNDDGVIDTEFSKHETTLQRYTPLTITLPPREVTVLEVRQLERLDDIRQRADVALSPLSTTLNDDHRLQVSVHNIGSQAAHDVEVGHYRDGQLVQTLKIKKIDAPLDLLPRVEKLCFDNVMAGDEIRVDPANLIHEISEHNNQLVVSASGD